MGIQPESEENQLQLKPDELIDDPNLQGQEPFLNDQPEIFPQAGESVETVSPIIEPNADQIKPVVRKKDEEPQQKKPESTKIAREDVFPEQKVLSTQNNPIIYKPGQPLIKREQGTEELKTGVETHAQTEDISDGTQKPEAKTPLQPETRQPSKLENLLNEVRAVAKEDSRAVKDTASQVLSKTGEVGRQIVEKIKQSVQNPRQKAQQATQTVKRRVRKLNEYGNKVNDVTSAIIAKAGEIRNKLKQKSQERMQRRAQKKAEREAKKAQRASSRRRGLGSVATTSRTRQELSRPPGRQTSTKSTVQPDIRNPRAKSLRSLAPDLLARQLGAGKKTRQELSPNLRVKKPGLPKEIFNNIKKRADKINNVAKSVAAGASSLKSLRERMADKIKEIDDGLYNFFQVDPDLADSFLRVLGFVFFPFRRFFNWLRKVSANW